MNVINPAPFAFTTKLESAMESTIDDAIITLSATNSPHHNTG
jgi:hypothetical protein